MTPFLLANQALNPIRNRGQDDKFPGCADSDVERDVVNLLEFLYAATVVSAILTLTTWLRSRRALAGRLLLAAIGLALVYAGMYWYLSIQPRGG